MAADEIGGDVAGTGSPGMQLLLVNLYALAGQTVP